MIFDLWYTAYDVWRMIYDVWQIIYLWVCNIEHLIHCIRSMANEKCYKGYDIFDDDDADDDDDDDGDDGDDEWWMMNDELCLPSTPFELSWPKCRVNGGRRRWAAPDQSEPQDQCSKFTPKSSKIRRSRCTPQSECFFDFFVYRNWRGCVVIWYVRPLKIQHKQTKQSETLARNQNDTGLTKNETETLAYI